MALSIGRKGWLGVALESSYNTPTNPTDYAPFTVNTLTEEVKNENINQAYTVRDQVFGSVPINKWAKGDIEMLLDPKLSGYFLVSAFGSVSVTNLGGGVFKHTVVRNNSNVPQSLTIISDRSTDRVEVTGAVVDKLTVSVKDSFATIKASMLGQFPVATTSGTATTASGTVFAFPQASFAFGTTVSGAQTAQNLKISDLTLNVDNMAQTVFRHGSANPDTINPTDFTVDASATIFFENVTDRTTFYNSTKQAASLKFTGAALPGGFSEAINFNFYQVRIDSFDLETGLSNFFAEKLKMVGEYDNVNAKTMDVQIVNQKSLYI